MVVITNAPLRLIIVQAYQLDPFTERFTLIGGSERVLSARFDIQAQVPAAAPSGQQHLMLQRLLAERFGLRMHTESRQVPAYIVSVLQAGRLGPRLLSSAHDCAAFVAARRANPSIAEPRGADGRPLCLNAYEYQAGTRTIRDAGPITSIVRRTQAYLDRPLVDGTGLTGTFEWAVSFAFGRNSEESGAPSVFTAFQEQLGLRLEPANAPMDVMVIDSIEMPTPN
jgi:uncharacterized protein (TIGR03435 family)